MKCSVCGTECAESTRYCPTCGTPVQGAAQNQSQTAYAGTSQQFAAQPQATQAYVSQQQPYEPTRQMPPYQQPSGQFARTGASQEFQAVPVNAAVPGRSVDMSAATKSPKWPIVLIIVLLVLIVALVLVILHPWDTGAQSGTADVVEGNVVVTSSADSGQQGDAATSTDAAQDGATVSDQANEQAVANAGDAYSQLTSAYNQLDGYHNQISSIATDFSDNVGVNDLTDVRNRAADLQSQIQNSRSALQGIEVEDGSAYAQTKSAIDNLYNDLEMRISVLVEACDAVLAGNDYSEILSRDNGAADDHGHTNKYLIDYENNYEAARPTQG